MADNLNVTKQRDSWFDNSKGILMITVVVGHFIASVLGKFDTLAFLSNYIYFFHMPAFAIISGFFLKRRVDTKDYASVINKTLIPYCFAQVVIYLFAIILPSGVRALSAERFADSGLFSFLFPMYHLWYFVGLIIAFAFLILVNAKEHPLRALILSLVISLASGAIPTVEFLKLTKVLAFLPFFVIGYLVPSGFMNKIKKKSLIPVSLILTVGVCAVLWLFRDKGTFTGIFAMTSRYDNFVFDIPYLQAVVVRFLFILSSVIYSFAFLNLCPRKKCIFTRLGEKSVYIYVLHVVFVAIVRHLHYEYGILFELDSLVNKIIYLVFCVVVCYLLTTPPVVKLFKKLFEPNFDIRKIPEYLTKK